MVVVDTHALIWFIDGAPNLSPAARDAINASIDSAVRVRDSSISLVEMVYLVEKGRIRKDQHENIRAELRRANSAFEVVPLIGVIADTMESISAKSIPDMPDRIIAATAAYLRCPLITRDRMIRNASIETLW